MKRIGYITILLLLLGCSSTRNVTDKVAFDVVAFDKNIEWKLVKMNAREVDEAVNVTLRFNPETLNFNAFAGCNNVSGRYKVEPDRSVTSEYTSYRFSFSDISRQKMQCPDNQMKFEGKFLAAMGKVNTCHLSAYELVLLQNDRELLRFER